MRAHQHYTGRTVHIGIDFGVTNEASVLGVFAPTRYLTRKALANLQ